MKARDLLKLLRDNPDLDVVIDDGISGYLSAVTEVGVRPAKAFNPGTERYDIEGQTVLAITIGREASHEG